MNKFKKNFDNDNYQNGLRVVLICVLAVALVVSINMFVGLIPTKIANIDISTDRVFSIGSDTEEGLKALDKPVELIYVCEKGEENHNAQVMLNLYADATDKITARPVDPAFDPQEIIKYTLIVVGSVPLLILYPFLQKYFVQGVLIGSLKE